MTLLPRSLRARAIIILSAVFLLSHAVGLLVYEANRSETVLLTEAADLADRVIGIVQLANTFPSRDRQRILAAAETQFLTMFPEVLPQDSGACQRNEYHATMAGRLGEAFRELEGYEVETCIRGLGHGRRLRDTVVNGGFDVLITLTFPDGERSHFHAVLPEEESLFADGSLPAFLGILALALLLAGFLIYRVVAPLNRLAGAAERIGVDVDAPSLPVEGPREVRTAAVALNEMQARLQRQIHSQRDILAAVSHDLRSSLTRLRLRADLLADDAAREGLYRVIDDMQRMVQSVLDFVRGIDTGEAPRRLELATLLQSLCSDMEDEGYAVDWREPADNPLILGRPAALRRCFQNLIDNAVSYGGRAGVALALVEEQVDGVAESFVEVTVRDCGPGIAPEHLEEVLMPFYRVEASRSPDTGGVGLGLPIAHNVANAHGGTLALANHPEGGLLVTVRLPLCH